jgi:hypothetical protein
MGGGSGSPTGTTTTSIDPDIKPYVTYGLQEGKNLYESGTPSFFPGQTYVDPSQATQSALKWLRNGLWRVLRWFKLHRQSN